MDPSLVKMARKDEPEEFRKHGVYEKVDIVECHDKTGKPPIGTKWVDVNKGDSMHPEYRSRLFAQEIIPARGKIDLPRHRHWKL